MRKMELPFTTIRKTSGEASSEERSKPLISRCQLDIELKIASKKKRLKQAWNSGGRSKLET